MSLVIFYHFHAQDLVTFQVVTLFMLYFYAITKEEANVVDQSSSISTTTINDTATDLPGTNLDTIGTLMVPAEDVETYTSELENGGLSVLSTHNFDDIRSDDQQALIVWGASSATNSIENIASQLSELTPTLPYS